MASVTLLRVSERRPNRVEVHLDGELAFTLAIDLAAALRRGQSLSDEDVARLRAEDDYVRALDRALSHLARRPRSRREVERYLAGKDVAPAAVERVMERLSALDLVDDAAFARWWVENRTMHRPRGRLALRSELAVRGVEAAAIAAATSGLEEDDLALEMALERAPRLAGLERPVFERRLGGMLARRGFGGAAVRAAVAVAWRQLGGARQDEPVDDPDA